jgi:hypothetical protein
LDREPYLYSPTNLLLKVDPINLLPPSVLDWLAAITWEALGGKARHVKVLK